MQTVNKYKNKKTGETIDIKADFSQASSQISGRWNNGEWYATPFQVADAKHNRRQSLRLVARWESA